MALDCRCGEPIPDEGTSLPGQGYLISDRDYTVLLATALKEFRAYLAADTPELRSEWLTRQFGLQWRRDLSDAEHLEAFVHALLMDRCRLVNECAVCGRLLIDEKTSDVHTLIDYDSPVGPRGLLAQPLFRREN